MLFGVSSYQNIQKKIMKESAFFFCQFLSRTLKQKHDFSVVTRKGN